MTERTRHEILEDNYNKALKKRDKFKVDLEEVEVQIELMEKELYGTSSLDAYLDEREEPEEPEDQADPQEEE